MLDSIYDMLAPGYLLAQAAQLQACAVVGSTAPNAQLCIQQQAAFSAIQSTAQTRLLLLGGALGLAGFLYYKKKAK